MREAAGAGLCSKFRPVRACRKRAIYPEIVTDVRIDILTLFPNICVGPLSESIMRRAQNRGLVQIHAYDLRSWAQDKHRVTDDAPYGGGQGMVMKAEPIFLAVESLRTAESRVVLMSPAGRLFNHQLAREFSLTQHLILICGHYEGVDQRVIDQLVDDEISIGDYVLTNGALAAAVFTDAVVRLIPGVLGDEASAVEDSHATGLLEYPQYTRPVRYRGLAVPEILLSGNHREIAKWRIERAKEKTKRVRPDLLAQSEIE
jgi:tRNA (guanine37-N1)-methyltransferase